MMRKRLHTIDLLRVLSFFVFSVGVIASPLDAVGQIRTAAQIEAEKVLFDALEADDEKRVRTLLLRGADPNLRNYQQQPAIVFAASRKSFIAVRVLLETPETQVNAENPQGENALMLASLHGSLPTVKLLIAKGAEINKPGWTPLHYAATNGQLEVARLLIEQHAFIDAMSPNKTTPLMMAARQKNPTIARFLVDEGADPTQRNEAGLSVADYFLRHGEKEHAEWFRTKAREFEARYGTLEKPRLIETAPGETSGQKP
jgi:uncharacterized protein